MGKNCVIYIKDRMYGNRLIKLLSGRGSRQLNISLLSDMEELDRYTTIDAILTDEESYSDVLKERYSCPIVVLTEEQLSIKQADGIYGQEIGCVCRYQSADSLYRQIVERIGVRKKQKLVSTEILGVYTPLQAIPRQTFALNMAKVLAEKYKVLYINLDVFSGLSEIMPQSEAGGMSEAMYYYRQGGDSCLEKIKELVSTVCGVDYISSVRCQEDFECISDQELVELIDCMVKSKEYEVVLLDIYFGGNKLNKLLEICDQVYLPIKNDYVSCQRIKDMEQFYLETGKIQLFDGVNKVALPEGEQGICKDFWEKIECGGMYRYVKSLFKKDV